MNYVSSTFYFYILLISYLVDKGMINYGVAVSLYFGSLSSIAMILGFYYF